jgi:hypothetical protein
MISFRIIFVAVFFVVVAGIALVACTNENKVQENLLEKTPIGTSLDQVMLYCKNSNLKCYHSDTAGYLNQSTGKVVGVKSIWAVLNEHKYIPLTITSVSAYWGFDKDGKLIDIWIWQTIDAP